jgi:hypothetical protein
MHAVSVRAVTALTPSSARSKKQREKYQDIQCNAVKLKKNTHLTEAWSSARST